MEWLLGKFRVQGVTAPSKNPAKHIVVGCGRRAHGLKAEGLRPLALGNYTESGEFLVLQQAQYNPFLS